VASPPPFLIIGNPENRRVMLFQAALAAQGLPAARVVAWLDLARDLSALEAVPDEPFLVRVDSFGESFEVERALLAHGFEDARAAGVSTLPPRALGALREDRGRILAPRQHHLGLLRVLTDVERVFASKRAWTLLNPVASVRDLFDKRTTSRTYASLGVPVPRALDDVESPAALRAAMRAAGMRSVYVKLSCASSASCLAIYEAPSDALPHGEVLTTIEIATTGYYNSRRLRRYTTRERVDAVLGFLLREGSQVEESVPKARLDGAYFDCRVVVIAGEPAFTVVRTSPHPITNLHLGGRRGDLARMEALVPISARDEAMRSCRAIHAAHGALHVGVDVMYPADLAGHRVLEANAFGDLLPNLTRDGLSVYEWEIREATRADVGPTRAKD
jgi:hypothetical protein